MLCCLANKGLAIGLVARRAASSYLSGMSHCILKACGAFGAGAWCGDSGARVPDLEGDFSLNAANAVAASALLGMGLTRLAPTHDLSGAQLLGLARSMGRRWGKHEGWGLGSPAWLYMHALSSCWALHVGIR